MSGAYQELIETGTLGAQGAQLLYRTVSAVARFDHYPPPEGHASWTSEAVTEVAHDFLAGERSTERLIQLTVLANDERSFARLLEAAVRNFFRSQTRATERGRLYRRIRGLLESDTGFVQVAPGGPGAGWWMLSGGPAAPWTGRIDDLVRVASSVSLSVVRWREGPVADRVSLRELCQRIMAAAEGAVALEDIVGVAALRLGLGRPPLVTPIDAPDVSEASDVESETIGALLAQSIFDQLTPRERLLVLVLDEPVREAGQFLGVSKSTAAEGLSRLRAKLGLLLPQTDERLEALRQLALMVARWADERTDEADSASRGG